MKGKLSAKVIEGVETVRIVEALLILTMASLNLAVVPGSIGTNQLVADAEVGSGRLKESRVCFQKHKFERKQKKNADREGKPKRKQAEDDEYNP